MRVWRLPGLFATVLSVIPVFGQQGAVDERPPTYEGRVFGEDDNIRGDVGAFNALQAVPAGSGLEVESYREIRLAVAAVPDDLRHIGVTEDQIRTRVQTRLRSLNLTPLPEEDPRTEWLSVEVNGVGSSYRIDVSLMRRAFYVNASQREFFLATDVEVALVSSPAVTWSTGSVGTHAGDSTFVFNSLDRRLEEFLSQYLDANQP